MQQPRQKFQRNAARRDEKPRARVENTRVFRSISRKLSIYSFIHSHSKTPKMEATKLTYVARRDYTVVAV